MKITSTTLPASAIAPDELRFGFGKNWSDYSQSVNAARIEEAEKSLVNALGVTSLKGKRFLDIGCGSGLFSLAACRLGAIVRSFDYDRYSVQTTQSLRDKFFKNQSADWQIEQGSVLDQTYMSKYKDFDVVYSWGVLHHTGSMYKAFESAQTAVAPQGLLFISIYNDQGFISKVWWTIKKIYNQAPVWLRPLIIGICLIRLWGPALARDFLQLRPFHSWRAYYLKRGMSPMHDVVDWVGGFPFEVAKPEKVFDFFKKRGFQLEYMTTCGGGLGCNEFVFKRT